MKPTRLTVSFCRFITGPLMITALITILGGAVWISAMLQAWVFRARPFDWQAPGLLVAGILVGLLGHACDQHQFRNQHIK
jgi:hypothetical protein